MTDVMVLDLAQKAIYVALEIMAPLLGVSLTVGLGVSVFQAATQVQENNLTFVPKLMALVGALVVSGPWILRTITAFTTHLLIDLPKYIR